MNKIYIMKKGQQPKKINAKKTAVKPAKQVQLLSTPILNYACLVKCEVMEHSRKKIEHCPKCGWICNTCKENSKLLKYVYVQPHTHQHACVLHFDQSGPVIHYTRKHYLTLYDLKSKKRTTINMVDWIKSNSVYFEGIIYLVGGIGKRNEPTGQLYAIDMKTKKKAEKAKMLTIKVHDGICIALREIYSIGGLMGKDMFDCQKYSIAADKWLKLPNLESPMSDGSAFSFNDMDVYIYGEKNHVEKISVNDPLKWEVVAISGILETRSACQCQAIQITAGQVLLFGG